MRDEKPMTHMRRQDRAVTDDAWIRAFLRRTAFGALAMTVGGQPFINSNIFVYDEEAHAIFMHSAHTGRTPTTLSERQPVCFSVSEMGRLLPADEALEFSVEYAGVMVFGTANLITDPADAEHGLQLLLDKYAPHLRPGRDYRPIAPEELKRTAVYRINIEAWSGKQKQVPDEFPGAYYFADVLRDA